LLLLIIIVSIWHADRFKPGPTTWVWYAVCLAGVLAFGVALLLRPDRMLTQGAAA
jgi:hypothetical protein